MNNMSATPEINRENAQHSTGPKTEEGKKKSSLNALRHGLTGQIVVMPSEDLAAYQIHVSSFKNDLQPKGSLEAHLVQSLADTAWRLNRVAALETNLLTLGVARVSDAFSCPQEIQQALAIASTLESRAKALSNLSMHSQRLSRQFERTVNQLRELQKTRRDQEAQAMNQALDLLETAEKNGESYDPTTDGFVFSKPEIAAALHLRNRARRAQKATIELLKQAA
jgi:hypothetical protein